MTTLEIVKAAKAAAPVLMLADTELKNAALLHMADAFGLIHGKILPVYMLLRVR